MASITGQQIREELAKWGLVQLGEMTTAGTTTSITDIVRLRSALYPSTKFDGSQVRLTGGVGAGEQSVVDYLDGANGVLYLNPVITTAAVGSYEIWRQGVDPDDVDRSIDEALIKLCSQWAPVPVSQILNGDFEDPINDYANWDDGGSGATVRRATDQAIYTNQFAFVDGAGGSDTITDADSGFIQAGFAVGDLIMVSGSASNDTWQAVLTAVAAGTLTVATATTTTEAAVLCTIRVIGGKTFPSKFLRNSLIVTANGADDFAESASTYVQPSWDLYIYVPVSTRTGTSSIIIYDVTNSAVIAAASGTVSATGRGWTGLEARYTIPAGCFEIVVRLNQATSGAISEWGPLHAHWIGQRRIHLPERVTTPEHVGSLYKLSSIQVGTASPFWAEETEMVQTRVKAEGIGQGVILRLDSEMGAEPYVYMERRFYDPLWNRPGYGYLGQEGATGTADFAANNRESGDARYTDCPLDYVTAATVRLLAEQYAYKQPENREFWAALHQRAQYELDIRERQYGPKPKPRLEHERQISIQQLPV